MRATWTRRQFLRTTALAVLGIGCGKGVESGETGLLDPVELSKQVYVQQLGTDSVRLRFETREDVALTVVITDPSGTETVLEAERDAQELEYEWNTIADNENVEGNGDEPGLHVLHTVTLTGLQRGGTYTWELRRRGGQVETGQFLVSPPAGTAFRFGWLADTMAVNTTVTMEQLAAEQPQLMLHGGDLVYQSHPYDTWVDWSIAMKALTALGSFMPTCGNHEFEGQDEITVMYDRLYGGQAESDKRWFAFTFGSVRFVAYDSESPDREGLEDWLEADLAAAAADPDVQHIVVYMHRPMYTLGPYWRENADSRDGLHAVFVQHGVTMVLAGHSHAYERFEVDGIAYVVDGGGGALLYNPDENLKACEAVRPEEVAARQTSHRSYGFCVFDVAADGTISLSRTDAESGTVVDTHTI